MTTIGGPTTLYFRTDLRLAGRTCAPGGVMLPGAISTRRYPGMATGVVLNVRVPEETHDTLAALAKLEHRSITATARELINEP
jgi:hypothetical protein